MKFQVTAIDARRQIQVLEFDARDEAEASASARRLGLTVLSATGRRAALPLSLPLSGKTAFPVALFSLELKSLLDAGLNLVEALQTLGEKEPHGERQVVLSGILEAIGRGESQVAP